MLDLTDVHPSERLLAALNKLQDGIAGEDLVAGLNDISLLVKRTDDVAEVAAPLVQAGLPQRLLSLLEPGSTAQYEGTTTLKMIHMEPATVPLSEAVQFAAVHCVGELVWSRDTSPDFRPAMLHLGVVGVMTRLILACPSERLRLKALVTVRRLLYEVGSTGSMDPAALEQAHTAGLLPGLLAMIPAAIESSDPSITTDTLESVNYLLQRMQVCMNDVQKETLQVAGHLQEVATYLTTQLTLITSTKIALITTITTIRELAWDDHNNVVEPAITVLAEAGAFDALAALLSMSGGVDEAGPRESKSSVAPGLATVSEDAEGLPEGEETVPVVTATQKRSAFRRMTSSITAVPGVSKVVVEGACALLQRLAAAPEGGLPQVLADQLPKLMHQVIAHLAENLDHSQQHERQQAALSALRKLLVTEASEDTPPLAAEAAEAEGLPARLRAVALSGTAFGAAADSTTPQSVAVAAASLLADICCTSALNAALGGRPAQAAEALQEFEPLVTAYVALLESNIEAPKLFCQALYRLSLVNYEDVVPEDDGTEIGASGTPRLPPPPEEEQYALQSQLVTMVSRVADGVTTLLLGPAAAAAKKAAAAAAAAAAKSGPFPGSGARAGAASSIPGKDAAAAAQEAAEAAAAAAAAADPRLLERLQRGVVLIHELAGLRPMVGYVISRHNLDALFVHGTFQALLQRVDAFYNQQKALHKAAAKATSEDGEGEGDAKDKEAEEAKAPLPPPPVDDPTKMPPPGLAHLSRSPVMLSHVTSLGPAANPVLQPLLHTDTGALELIKELLRDYAEARIKLRDMGAVNQFVRMLQENLRDNLLVSTCFHFARTEAVHAALKQAGVVGLMEKVLAQPQNSDGAQGEVRRLLALCTLGCITFDDGTAAKDARALALLEQHEIADVLQRVTRDACRDGRHVISSSTSAWPFMLEPAAVTVQCLARTPAIARKLADKKIPDMLIASLRNKHGSQPEPALRICRALLNFARIPELRPSLRAWGAAAAMQPYASSDDLRTADAARGTLLLLDDLQDPQAQAALQLSAVERLMGDPLASPSSRKTEAAPEVMYEVLISYKRLDAHDFARALQTLLVLRGVTCLLDYEYRQDLSDVSDVVSRCKNLLVVLTDNILNSPRCQLELEAATAHNLNIILVTKEGARWGDSSGNMVSFPPSQYIRTLKAEAQKVFSHKHIQHRDEHYAYFVNQLMGKVKRHQLTTSITPQRVSSTAYPLPPAGPYQSPSGRSFARGSLQHRPSGTGSVGDLHAAAAANSGRDLVPGGGGARSPVPPLPLQATAGMQPAAAAPLPPALLHLPEELASLKQGMAGLGQTLQGGLQSLQSDLGAVKREVCAEVTAAATRVQTVVSANVSAALTSASAAAASSHAADAAAAAAARRQSSSTNTDMGGGGAGMGMLKAELIHVVTSQVQSMKVELMHDMQAQLRGMGGEVAEIRRQVSLMADGLQGLQHMMKALMLMRGGGMGSPGMVTGGPDMSMSAPSPFTRTAPAGALGGASGSPGGGNLSSVMVADGSGSGATFHSSPIGGVSSAADAAGLHSLTSSPSSGDIPLTIIAGGGAGGTGTLPPIMNGYAGGAVLAGGSAPGSAGQLSGRSSQVNVMLRGGHSHAGAGGMPGGGAPMVGGFNRMAHGHRGARAGKK